MGAIKTGGGRGKCSFTRKERWGGGGGRTSFSHAEEGGGGTETVLGYFFRRNLRF